MWHRLAPNHEVLHYDNYLHANISEERVVFDRCFDPEWYCGFARDDRPGQLVGPWVERQNPGALVELRTNAARVRVTLEYVEICDVGCATNSGPPGPDCYIPRPERGTCVATCEPTLYVDGERRALPPASIRTRYHGVLALDILTDTTGASLVAERHLEIVLPWTGIVEIKGLELYDDGKLTFHPAPLRRPFTYLAYGDSITQGFCGDLPYPDQVGRLNNWRTINLGWGGLQFKPSQGAPIGQIPADLISIALGTNNWPGGQCDLATLLGQTLDGIRAGQPQTPIVVMTPFVRAGEENRRGQCQWNLEDARVKLRGEVARRTRLGDHHLYVVEGVPLLPLSGFSDGLHPGSGESQRSVAKVLNAEFHRLGFATELRCYVERYPDLLAGFCQDSDPADCRWESLQEHWDLHGRFEDRIFGCPMPPTPPMPPFPPPPPLPSPSPLPPPPSLSPSPPPQTQTQTGAPASQQGLFWLNAVEAPPPKPAPPGAALPLATGPAMDAGATASLTLAVMATRAAYLVDPLSTGLVLGLMTVVVACLAFCMWRSCRRGAAPATVHPTGPGRRTKQRSAPKRGSDRRGTEAKYGAVCGSEVGSAEVEPERRPRKAGKGGKRGAGSASGRSSKGYYS